MSNQTQDLIGKYNVSRVDGKKVGDCIVLPFDDPNSWSALHEWANEVENEGYHQLAVEVRAKVRQHMTTHYEGG